MHEFLVVCELGVFLIIAASVHGAVSEIVRAAIDKRFFSEESEAE